MSEPKLYSEVPTRAEEAAKAYAESIFSGPSDDFKRKWLIDAFLIGFAHNVKEVKGYIIAAEHHRKNEVAALLDINTLSEIVEDMKDCFDDILECDPTNEAAKYGLKKYDEYRVLSELPPEGRELTGWIDCKERLPEPLTDVLVYCNFREPRVLIGMLTDKKEYWNIAGVYESKPCDAATAWQPLPAPPSPLPKP